jgi:hypothetical protein
MQLTDYNSNIESNQNTIKNTFNSKVSNFVNPLNANQLTPEEINNFENLKINIDYTIKLIIKGVVKEVSTSTRKIRIIKKINEILNIKSANTKINQSNIHENATKSFNTIDLINQIKSDNSLKLKKQFESRTAVSLNILSITNNYIQALNTLNSLIIFDKTSLENFNEFENYYSQIKKMVDSNLNINGKINKSDYYRGNIELVENCFDQIQIINNIDYTPKYHQYITLNRYISKLDNISFLITNYNDELASSLVFIGKEEDFNQTEVYKRLAIKFLELIQLYKLQKNNIKSSETNIENNEFKHKLIELKNINLSLDTYIIDFNEARKEFQKKYSLMEELKNNLNSLNNHENKEVRVKNILNLDNQREILLIERNILDIEKELIEIDQKLNFFEELIAIKKDEKNSIESSINQIIQSTKFNLSNSSIIFEGYELFTDFNIFELNKIDLIIKKMEVDIQLKLVEYQIKIVKINFNNSAENKIANYISLEIENLEMNELNQLLNNYLLNN